MYHHINVLNGKELKSDILQGLGDFSFQELKGSIRAEAKYITTILNLIKSLKVVSELLLAQYLLELCKKYP